MKVLFKRTIELYDELNSKYKDWKYVEDYKEAGFFDSMKERIKKIINQDEIYGDEVLILEELALYHTEYFLFLSQKNVLGKEDIFHFQQSTAYSDILVETIVSSDYCYKHKPSVWMKNAGLFLSHKMINGKVEDIKSFIVFYIGSLEGTNSIFGYGHPKHHDAWFLIDLGVKYFNLDYSQDYAYLPEEYSEYETLLQNWDNEDMNTITIFVEMFCERKLHQALEVLKDYVAREAEGDAIEFVDITTFLYPYEILAWLKLREKAGLKNPIEYTHPLMNTPIAKMFLELKEPLEKPTELPYAKELLEKLKEKCPNVEIPEWLVEKKKKRQNLFPSSI
jgi:hypothetical protein